MRILIPIFMVSFQQRDVGTVWVAECSYRLAGQAWQSGVAIQIGSAHPAQANAGLSLPPGRSSSLDLRWWSPSARAVLTVTALRL